MAALEALLEELRNNRISKLRLPLDAHSDMPQLLHSLTRTCNDNNNNSSTMILEEVNIDIYESFRHRADATTEILELFEVLSASPKLQRLWVDSGREGSPFYTLNVEALALVLRRAPQLSRLALYDVELAGNRAQWTELENAVRTHSALQNFGLVQCRLAEDTYEWSTDETNTLRASLTLAAAAADNVDNGSNDNDNRSTTNVDGFDPSLILEEYEPNTCYALNHLVQNCLANCAWVELLGQEFEALGELTPTALGSLGASSSLTKLTLDYFDLRDRHIAALSRALETSQSLRELAVTCELGRVGCTAVSQLLFINTSLTNLTLQLNDVPMYDDPTVIEEIAVEDYNVEKSRDPTLLIAKALETNQTLQYFCLKGYAQISRKSREAFATLLRHNMTLISCELDLQRSPSPSDDLQREADMFLKLNELGRKELLEGPDIGDDNCIERHLEESSPQKWLRTLWEVRHDLDALYYLMSLNPTLCDLSGAPRVPEKRRSVPTYNAQSHLQLEYLLPS